MFLLYIKKEFWSQFQETLCLCAWLNVRVAMNDSVCVFLCASVSVILWSAL